MPSLARTGGKRLPKITAPILSILGGIVLWQLAITVLHPNQLAIVGPAAIVSDGLGLFRAGTLGPDIGLSLVELFAGLAIAIVAGTIVGVLLGTTRWIAGAVGPWITAFYTIPVIAVTPLVIVALGISGGAKVTIVAASGFFPIAINTQVGSAMVARGGLRDVARSFRADRWETLRYLTLPGTVPFILTGIRLSIGRALIALVAADLFGSTSGLGYLILSGEQNLKAADIYVGVVALSLIGIVLTALVGLVERRIASARDARTENA